MESVKLTVIPRIFHLIIENFENMYSRVWLLPTYGFIAVGFIDCYLYNKLSQCWAYGCISACNSFSLAWKTFGLGGERPSFNIDRAQEN